MTAPDTARVLIDDSLSANARATLFEQPFDIVRADTPEEVDGALQALSQALNGGAWAAGFFSYELGYLLEAKLQASLPRNRSVPLLLFALFDKCSELTAAETEAQLARWSTGGHRLSSPDLSIDQDAYAARFHQVADYIAAGDIYQLNFTLKARFSLEGCPVSLYRDLRIKQPVAYGALMEFGDLTILSHSPELFLKVDAGIATTRPMKGTAARGLTGDQDQAARDWLRSDAKSRAENLMIVDLMRNDLARASKPGGVRVDDLFSIETYATLHQMTSGVRSELRDDLTLKDLLRALFPAGSITGAPKVRAMEIIRELESEPRGVYTGAIGVMAPDGGMRLNVGIRTLVIDEHGAGEIGIGSGLVADSDAGAEYDECALKMRFLTDPVRSFELIETLLYDGAQGYVLLERHLERLESSAAYFSYSFDRNAVSDALDREVGGAEQERRRVRLLLARDGTVTVTSVPLAPPSPAQTMRYVLSEHRTDSADLFLYHKTTIREVYDGEHARVAEPAGADDVLFINERGELTEGSRTNIFIEREGVLLTPPLDSGVLPGTLRAELLADGRAREARLTLDDLHSGDPVYLGNSVRGLLPASPVGNERAQAVGG